MKTFWLQWDLGYLTLLHYKGPQAECIYRKPFDDGRDESLISNFGRDRGYLSQKECFFINQRFCMAASNMHLKTVLNCSTVCTVCKVQYHHIFVHSCKSVK